MSVLSDFEDRVGRAIEGVFAGVFRSPVQPAELARAAAREMDRGRKLGVGKMYAPTLYSILLSPQDGEALGGFASTLAGELETYLVGHAHERDYTLSCRPRVRFLVDEGLRLGRFEVIGELLSPDQIAIELGDEGIGSPRTASPAQRASAATLDAADTPAVAANAGVPLMPSASSPGLRIATVTVPGVAHDVALSGERLVVGRLKTCGIPVQDVNASREHAAFEREGDGWTIVDLHSTNGTFVNGRPVSRARLEDGDIITVGVTELTYHEPEADPR